MFCTNIYVYLPNLYVNMYRIYLCKIYVIFFLHIFKFTYIYVIIYIICVYIYIYMPIRVCTL